MGVLERLREESWREGVRSGVLASGLAFSPCPQDLQCYRDEQALADIPEYGGLQHVIAFARGRHDNWLAPVLRRNDDGTVSIAYPRDEYYFYRIAALGLEYGCDRVYGDMRLLYAMADSQVRAEAVQELARMSEGYGADGPLMFDMMMHVYYGMVAEEHYQRLRPDGRVQRTKVGKMMKLHALYRMLVEHVSVEECATECVGMSPGRIAEQAAAMGIVRTEPEGAYSSPYDREDLLPETEYGDTKGGIS